jgi:hypothetical protein
LVVLTERIVGKIRVCQVFNNNPQGSRIRGHPKKYYRMVYKQVLINTKLQFAKRCQKADLTGRNAVRWQRSALECSAIEEEEEEEER